MQSLLDQLTAMSVAEVVGTVFGLLSVVLTVRAHVACWPTGIVSVLSYAVLFVDLKLYADAALQIFFVATSIAGWRLWLRGGEARAGLEVTRLPLRARLAFTAATALAVLGCAAALARFTDASLPLADAAIAGLSVTAQLLLMRKKVESWAVWVAVDVLSIGVYAHKGVYLTALLYGVFLVLALKGHFEWKRMLRRDLSTRDSVTASSSESSDPRTLDTVT